MNTTIAISPKIRDEIKEFGNKGETYNAILERLLSSIKEKELEELLLDTTTAIPIEEALERATKKWQK